MRELCIEKTSIYYIVICASERSQGRLRSGAQHFKKQALCEAKHFKKALRAQL